MIPAHKKVYKAALKDSKFIEEFCSINRNEPPNQCSDGIYKAIFGAYYLGWLIGKYGSNKGNQIYSDIINK